LPKKYFRMSLSIPTTSMPYLARKLAADAPIKPALPVTIAMDIYEPQNCSYFFKLTRIVDCFQMPLLKRVKPAFSGERGRLPDGIPACVA
jgi:hypothetical protein